MLPTFFINQALEKEKPLLIDYDDDFQTALLFEAIAAQLLSLIKTHDTLLMTHLKTLLTFHSKYFPKQLPFHITHLEAKDQLNYLLTYTLPHQEKLLPSLAHTLQQSAIDILSKYPEEYGNLLLEGMLIEQLRQMKNLDHPSLLQALSDHILHSNIYIERYPFSYQLPVKESYLCAEQSHRNLYLHHQNNIFRYQKTTKQSVKNSEE